MDNVNPNENTVPKNMETYAEILLKNLPQFFEVTTNSSSEEQKKYRNFLETNDKIVLCDSTQDLDMFNYVSCDNDEKLVIKHSRGIIFNKNTLIARSFPYTIEFTHGQRENVVSLIEKYGMDKLKFYPSIEGTLIRMFFFNEKWYISTHRKLDAMTCTWGHVRESYGEMFLKELSKLGYDTKPWMDIENSNIENQDFTQYLDREKVYMFLLASNDKTRIVSHTNGGVYFVGGFRNYTFFLDPPNNFPTLGELEFSNIDDIFDYVSNVNPFMEQGIMIHFPDLLRVKILNDRYHYYFSLRGNLPSINFAYLKNRKNTKDNESFRKLYPNNVGTFDKYETTLDEVAVDLFNLYKEKYINGKYMVVSGQKHWILKQCNDKYRKDRKEATLDDIKFFMEKQNHITHNNFIREKLGLGKGEK